MKRKGMRITMTFVLCLILVLTLAGTAAGQGRTGEPKGEGNAIQSIVVSTTPTPTDLAEMLVGEEVVLSNVTYTGAAQARGSFSGGTGNVEIESGVILGSGRVVDAVGPNDSDVTTSMFGTPGDSNLDSLIPGYGTHDAAVLEFDFQCPEGSVGSGVISFSYVFSSEEYNEWVYFGADDVFGLFMNGANIALLPDGTPVSVDTVNNGQSLWGPLPGTNPKNPACFRNNDLQNYGGSIDIEADGLTVVLEAQGTVNSGVPNHVKLAIADAGDASHDSWVFIEAGSYVCAPLQNEPPVADPNGPYTGTEGVGITFDGSGSHDPDGNIVSYDWTFGDGGSGSGVAPVHAYADDGLYDVCLTVTDDFGLTDTECTTAMVANANAVVTVDPASQTVQYSDDLCDVTFTAVDVAADTLTATPGTLPDNLSLSAQGCVVNGIWQTCTWTLSGEVVEAAGAYVAAVTVADEDGGSGYAETTIAVEQEDATIWLDPNNPVALQADTPGGDSPPFVLTAYVQEPYPDASGCGANAGDVGNAEVSISLVPVEPGSPITLPCVHVGVVGTGYDAILQVACTFDNVPVNTYTVQASVAGGYYIGGPDEGALVIYDPSLGFTTGGGWFYWPGTADKTNFGFVMRYSAKLGTSKGSLLLIRHTPDGNYRVKSNAFTGLRMGYFAEGGRIVGWASFTGKATYIEPGWPAPVRNYQFTVYVEDWTEPGAGYDQFWLEVKDGLGAVVPAMSMPGPPPDNTVTLDGGNIAVPHASN